MTHDELLAKIDESIKGAEFEERWMWTTNAKALRAIVLLHAPCTGERHSDDISLMNEPCVCVYCPDDIWPCESIQIIEKELM